MTCGLSDLKPPERIIEGDRKPGSSLVRGGGGGRLLKAGFISHTRTYTVMADRCVVS